MGRRAEGEGAFPTLGEVGVGSDILFTGWMPGNRMHVGPTGFHTPPAALIVAATTQMQFNSWRHWDTTAGDLRAFMPRGNPVAGDIVTISNAVGANNVLLETFGGTASGNVRNTAGADDVIDVSTVPPGVTATYRCDGGNGVGAGVARWTLIHSTHVFGAPVLPTFSNSTRPSPTDLAAGTPIYNTDDTAPNYADGAGNWRSAAGALT